MASQVRASIWGAVVALIVIAMVALSFTARPVAYDLDAEATFAKQSAPLTAPANAPQGVAGLTGSSPIEEEEEDHDAHVPVAFCVPFTPVVVRAGVAESSSFDQRERNQPPVPPPLS